MLHYEIQGDSLIIYIKDEQLAVDGSLCEIFGSEHDIEKEL